MRENERESERERERVGKEYVSKVYKQCDRDNNATETGKKEDRKTVEKER